LKTKLKIIVIALIAGLATLSLVAADEAGVFTINIQNSNGQINTTITNSTVQGQTNYTDSQAAENITLNNSTLTLNVNGQDIVISSQGGNIDITSGGQSVLVNPNRLYVTYLKSQSPESPFPVTNTTTQYVFNVTVTVPTGMNCPFGLNATHNALDTAFAPLASTYNLQTRSSSANNSTMVPQWVDRPTVSGQNEFSLFSAQPLTDDQIKSLTNDLYNAFTLAMSGTVG
jgi:hypothetical protein